MKQFDVGFNRDREDWRSFVAEPWPQSLSRLDNVLLPLNKISAELPVLIAGPTASGKSALAMAIAAGRGGVIINADALQVWDCWRLLTARPDAEDEAALPHRLYGHKSPGCPYSVGHWLREVQHLLAEGVRPIIVGGTGLYFTALTGGLAEIPAIPAAIRAEADGLRLSHGTSAMLRDLDARTALRIDRANPMRVQRAWEVQRATGRGLADWQDDTGAPILDRKAAEAIVLSPERDVLAERIGRRFDGMVAGGAIDEVSDMLAAWDPDAQWARAIGAPDLVACLRGEIPLDEAVLRAKAATRQYAKRQRSWFRGRMKDWRWIEAA
ncbi:MAG: tRNA (adenosine(37)-N6)-dimethylallyltransferase MiaA [Rhodobacteraceae bacterium]|nr:tRNA (adenosine(37)-N6)-dimethylallyltransferase MiaA [Paracoccaceae bacterium]